jgi:hypothetical protein
MLGAALAFASATTTASAAVLFVEDFSDDTLTTNGHIDGDQAAVVGGVLSVNDNNRDDKGVFNVVQDFNAPVMTFSFDVVAPVVHTGDPNELDNNGVPYGVQTELMIRTGRGTGTDSIGSGDDINELVLQRDGGNRSNYSNNGNESIFLVANNSAGTLNFASPVDGSNVTLNNMESVAFIRNNDNGTFVHADGPEAWQLLVPITRFFIGSGSNSDMDTFSIDNVGVVDQVSFETVAVPEPSALALIGLGGLLGVRRRRSA